MTKVSDEAKTPTLEDAERATLGIAAIVALFTEAGVTTAQAFRAIIQSSREAEAHIENYLEQVTEQAQTEHRQ